MSACDARPIALVTVVCLVGLLSAACDLHECPSGTTSRTVYVTTLPAGCPLQVTSATDVITYSTTCGFQPTFQALWICTPTPPERPAEKK